MASSFEIERARKQQELGIIPYQGTEPFIFISYAHRDFKQVFPVIKALMDHGFRVWYDEGIDPGTEWDDNIAAYVERCYCMLSFLSGNYLASKNCLDELSFARDLEKQQLFVYLEKAKLPRDLALRFGRLQAIHQYTYTHTAAFNKKLFSAKVLARTLQTTTPQENVSAIEPQPAASVHQPAVRKPDLQAISALFEFEQTEDCITITKLKDTNCTAIDIPWGVTGIGHKAFWSCESLTSITIPDSVTGIGHEAFAFCTSLTSITIPNSVTGIGYDAFQRCESLTSITIPNSVTSIEDAAFWSCESLTSITIPDSVRSIGRSAFYGCTSLTSITIPNSVTSISNSAFSNCTNLTSITIPDSVRSIGGFAFFRCYGLTRITIPKSVTSIGEVAFYGCERLIIRGKRGSYAERYAAENSIPFRVKFM